MSLVCYCFLVTCNAFFVAIVSWLCVMSLFFHDYFFLLFMIVCNVFCFLSSLLFTSLFYSSMFYHCLSYLAQFSVPLIMNTFI